MHLSRQLTQIKHTPCKKKYHTSTESLGWIIGGITFIYGAMKLGEYLRSHRIKSETYDDYMKLLSRADAMLKIYPKVAKFHINIEGVSTFREAHKIIVGKFKSVERDLSKVGFPLYVYDGSNHDPEQKHCRDC